MTEIVKFTPSEVAPQRAAVLEHQGIPARRSPSADVEAICRKAIDLFLDVAEPIGMLKEIAEPQFTWVYEGDGRNEPHTPVGDILRKADRLALFAVTLGQRISREIAARFKSNDLALGCMLDSAASVGADRLAERLERRYAGFLAKTGKVGDDTRTLRYSPGYCGWHISGQRRLFEFLGPGEIGISLRKSHLMDPLKSVSGVVIVGPKEIHQFDMGYSCCAECRARSCRARIKALDAE